MTIAAFTTVCDRGIHLIRRLRKAYGDLIRHDIDIILSYRPALATCKFLTEDQSLIIMYKLDTWTYESPLVSPTSSIVS